MKRNKGWRNEPLRHSLARKGVKTKGWKVTAFSVNKSTGFQSPERTEKIEPDNELFKGAKSEREVEKRYESFWNDLPTKSPNEKVIVKKVKEIK